MIDIDTCLDDYPERFKAFITMQKDCFDIDQKTFESLLPSKELIIQDEKQYFKYRKQCDDDKHKYLEVSQGDIRSFSMWPESYILTYDLLKGGIKALERYPELMCYVTLTFHHDCVRLTKDVEVHKMTFTKQEFIQSTKAFGESKEKVKVKIREK